MDGLEIKKEFAMSYQEFVGYLLKKYGVAQYDYSMCNRLKKSSNSDIIKILWRHM